MQNKNTPTEGRNSTKLETESALRVAACSPSPLTPETDAKRDTVAMTPTALIDMTEHAREMERQRNHARKCAEYIRGSFLKLAGGHPESILFDWENSQAQPRQ